MTFIDNRDLKIGGVAQIGWTKYNGQLDTPAWFSPGFVTVDIKEIQVSVGALYRWTNYISIYGGPFYHLVTGEFDFNFVSSIDIFEAQVVNSEYTWDIQCVSDFGGYLGTRVDIAKNLYLNCEYQMTADADSLAAGIVWKY